MKHIWSVLCEKSIIDSESNNISLFNVLERLNVTLKETKVKKAQEIVQMNYELVSFLQLESQDKESFFVNVCLVDPNGKELRKLEMEVPLSDKGDRIRHRLRIQGLPITVPGVYDFKVSLKSTEDSKYSEVGKVPLVVNIKRK